MTPIRIVLPALLIISGQLFVQSIPCTAQQPNGSLVETDDRGSEVASVTFDELTQQAVQQHASIFVINRLGATENRKYSYRRLHNALYRLTEYYGSYPHANVIGAIGERTRGRGVMEIYLAGTLRYRATLRKNRDFIVDCCELSDEPPPREYYPYYRGAPKYKFN